MKSKNQKTKKCDFCEKPCGNKWCPTIAEEVKKEEKKEEEDENDVD
jgi:hypothetical protein